MMSILICGCLSIGLLGTFQGEADLKLWEGWIATGQTPATIPTEPPLAQVAWHLGQLARDHQGELSPLQEEVEVRALLQAWSDPGLPLTWQDPLEMRLRGRMNEVTIPIAVAMLADPATPRREDLLRLLMSWGSASPHPALFAFVRDEEQATELRARLAEGMILAHGRPALEALWSTVHPGADELYLNRIFAAWRGRVEAEDFPRLRRLAHELDGVPAQYALQLWALNARAPEERMEIYRLALEAPPNYRQVALDALATGGKDAAIAAALATEFDGVDPDMQALARRLLPRFGSAEDLWQAYLSHGRGRPEAQRRLWMRDLALSTLPQARQEAAAWLADGGWQGSLGLILVRILVASEEMDALLPTLLNDEQVPARISFPLALERAKDSAAAREFLRRALVEEDGLRRSQAIQALAAAGEAEDLQRLAAMVQDPALNDHHRAEIITAMAPRPAARALVDDWMSNPPATFESAAALVKALIHSPLESDRAWATTFAQQPTIALDAEEEQGLRIVLWQQLGAAALPRALATLEPALLAQWESLRQEHAPPEQPWPHLATLLNDQVELTALLNAYQACAAAVPADVPVGAGLLAQDMNGVPAALLTTASARLAQVVPAVAWHWLDAAAAASHLPQNRLRIDALRAFLAHGQAPEAAALATLLDQPQALWDAPRLLAQGFPAVGEGWVLWQDRLSDRLLLAEVRSGRRPWTALERYAQGWTEAILLDEAVANLMAAEDPAALDLALALAQQGVRIETFSAEAYARLAKVATACGEEELARACWETVLGLTAPGTPLAKGAQAALNR